MRRKTGLIFITAAGLILSACGEGNREREGMWIAPGEFSAETENVLKLFEDELQFYDISLDKSARYQKVSIWTCQDGIWQESGRICGEIADASWQLAVRLLDDRADVYTICGEEYKKSTYPHLPAAGEDSETAMETSIQTAVSLEFDQEIPLWVKVAGKDVTEIPEDFRNLPCSSGTAVTFTVSEQPLE